MLKKILLVLLALSAVSVFGADAKREFKTTKNKRIYSFTKTQDEKEPNAVSAARKNSRYALNAVNVKASIVSNSAYRK